MTTAYRAMIEFQRAVSTDDALGDANFETVNADVLVDGESVAIDFPAPGRWPAINLICRLQLSY